jgi:hypothetical protein
MVRELLHPAAETAAAPAEPASNSSPSSSSPAATGFITEFLAFYKLASYQESLKASLESGGLEQLAGQIRKETGLQMVSLENAPPAFVSDRYSLLEIQLADGEKRFLLFWKPGYLISAFHENYIGDEILSLQRELQLLKYYRFNLDGIVGKHLIKAVQEFQVQQQISATGQPDIQTLFLLAQVVAQQG